MFWKKKEEPIPETGEEEDFSKPIGIEEPMGLEHEAPGVPEKPPIPLTPPPGAEPAGMDRNTELILAKLDAVKARMESIDARLAHIEKLAEE